MPLLNFDQDHLLGKGYKLMNKSQQNLSIILIIKMRQQVSILLAFIALSLALIVPFIATSITKPHKVKPQVDHSLDATFIPSLESSILEVKAKQLEKRIKGLQQGNSCSGPEGEVCENLKKQYNRLFVQTNLALQTEADLRAIYQSKWNTTCQSWKHEQQRLLNESISKNYELNNNSLKIQRISNQITQLNAKIGGIEPCKQCQKCQGQQCKKCPPSNCPKPQPCPKCTDSCPICEQCHECPPCHDQEYNQLHDEYTTLYRNFQQCQASVEKYKQKSIQPLGCTQNQTEQVKSYLKKGLASLSASFQAGQFGSQHLKDLVKKLGQQLKNSQTIEQSLAIVPSVVNGLSTQWQEITKEQKDKCGKCQDKTQCDQKRSKLVDECMSLFKKALNQLKNCENKLEPFIENSQK